jgi:hypothetical protein
MRSLEGMWAVRASPDRSGVRVVQTFTAELNVPRSRYLNGVTRRVVSQLVRHNMEELVGEFYHARRSDKNLGGYTRSLYSFGVNLGSFRWGGFGALTHSTRCATGSGNVSCTDASSSTLPSLRHGGGPRVSALDRATPPSSVHTCCRYCGYDAGRLHRSSNVNARASSAATACG